MQDFQTSEFVPFEHYVKQAIAKSAVTPGRRVTDFPDAVSVEEIPTDVVIVDDVLVLEDHLEEKLKRARAAVAARAFAECLHAGYFPPKCQSCRQ